MKKIKQMIYKLDEFLSILALIGIIGVVSGNIFSRFFFNNSIPWTEEISLGLFVWLVFTGFSVVIKSDGHVSIDYFVRKLPKKLRSINQYIVIGAIFLSIILIFIVWGSQLAFQSTWNMTPVLGIGYEWIYLAVPVGGILSIYHVINLLINKSNNYLLKEEEV